MAAATFGLTADAADTGGGTQTFTATGVAATPTAVMRVTSSATAEDTVTANAIMGIGCAVGAAYDRASIGKVAEDGQGTTDTMRVEATNKSLLMTHTSSSGGGTRGELDWVSFGSNVVNSTWDETPSAANQILSLLIKATNVDFSWVDVTSSGVSISPGFDIDVAIIFSSNGSTGNYGNQSVGFVVNGDALQQCAYAMVSVNGQGAGTLSAIASATKCGFQMSTTTPNVSYNVTASFPSDSQITLTSDTSGDEFKVLLLNIGDSEAWCGIVDSPTSAGDKTFTDPGFQPALSWIVTNTLQAVDTGNATGLAGAFGHAIATAGANYSVSNTDEDGAGITVCKSLFSTNGIEQRADDNTTLFVATLTEMAALGPKFNFTYVDGTAAKWPALFIGAAAVSGARPQGPLDHPFLGAFGGPIN